MDVTTIYTIGISTAVIIALLWSFVLDKNKPPTAKEFVAKLVARALVLVVILAVVVGVITLAMGLPES